MICNVENLNFLVIESNHIMRGMIVHALRSIVVSDDFIVSCDSLRNATVLLETSCEFDFIIMDWVFPQDTQLAKRFLKNMRAVPAYSEIPVLVIAMRGAQNDILEALESGAHGYLFKGFSTNDLKEKIKKILYDVHLGQKPFTYSVYEQLQTP